MAKKSSFSNATNADGKSVKRFTEKQVLEAAKWDENHINAIKTYFRMCKELGDDEPVFTAADNVDLILDVESFFDLLVAEGLKKSFLEIVSIPGVDTMSVLERISGLMDEIKKEHLEMFLADIKEFRECYSEDQLESLEAFFIANGLSLN